MRKVYALLITLAVFVPLAIDLHDSGVDPSLGAGSWFL